MSVSWCPDGEENGGEGIWRGKQRMSSSAIYRHTTNLPETVAKTIAVGLVPFTASVDQESRKDFAGRFWLKAFHSHRQMGAGATVVMG